MVLTKEKFIELITEYKEFAKRVDLIDSVLQMSFFESPVVEFYYRLFGETMNICFKEEGVDLIMWWLLEKNNRPEFTIEEDGKEIPSETIEDLWNIVNKYLI